MDSIKDFIAGAVFGSAVSVFWAILAAYLINRSKAAVNVVSAREAAPLPFSVKSEKQEALFEQEGFDVVEGLGR